MHVYMMHTKSIPLFKCHVQHDSDSALISIPAQLDIMKHALAYLVNIRV